MKTFLLATLLVLTSLSAHSKPTLSSHHIASTHKMSAKTSHIKKTATKKVGHHVAASHSSHAAHAAVAPKKASTTHEKKDSHKIAETASKNSAKPTTQTVQPESKDSTKTAEHLAKNSAQKTANAVQSAPKEQPQAANHAKKTAHTAQPAPKDSAKTADIAKNKVKKTTVSPEKKDTAKSAESAAKNTAKAETSQAVQHAKAPNNTQTAALNDYADIVDNQSGVFIQMGAFRTNELAQAQAARVSLLGVPTKVKEIRDPQGNIIRVVHSLHRMKQVEAEKMMGRLNQHNVGTMLIKF